MAERKNYHSQIGYGNCQNCGHFKVDHIGAAAMCPEPKDTVQEYRSAPAPTGEEMRRHIGKLVTSWQEFAKANLTSGEWYPWLGDLRAEIEWFAAYQAGGQTAKEGK